MDILSSIESHLRLHQIPPSRFGRQLCNDPRLVFDLRMGRQIGEALQTRIHNHIKDRTKRDQDSDITTFDKSEGSHGCFTQDT